jgi:hypothetical protein
MNILTTETYKEATSLFTQYSSKFKGFKRRHLRFLIVHHDEGGGVSEGLFFEDTFLIGLVTKDGGRKNDGKQKPKEIKNKTGYLIHKDLSKKKTLFDYGLADALWLRLAMAAVTIARYRQQQDKDQKTIDLRTSGLITPLHRVPARVPARVPDQVPVDDVPENTRSSRLDLIRRAAREAGREEQEFMRRVQSSAVLKPPSTRGRTMVDNDNHDDGSYKVGRFVLFHNPDSRWLVIRSRYAGPERVGQITKRQRRNPLTYTIEARKPNGEVEKVANVAAQYIYKVLNDDNDRISEYILSLNQQDALSALARVDKEKANRSAAVQRGNIHLRSEGSASERPLKKQRASRASYAHRME